MTDTNECGKMSKSSRKPRILSLGIALDGSRLARSMAGGSYYSFKIYDYFLRLPWFQVDHDGVSSLTARQLGMMMKFHLYSLYLLIIRGHRHYKYVFVNGWVCPTYLLFSKLRGSKIVSFWFHRTSKLPELGVKDCAVRQLREWRQLRIADKVVIISKSTLNSLRELGFVGDDYVLASPGLDKDVWIDRTSRYDPFRPGFKVVCVASITLHKGIMDLVVAFAEFLGTIEDREERRGIILDIVGNDQTDTKFTSELRGAIRDRDLKDNVFLRGRRSLEDVMGYYRDASVFVHPSHYEGWGMVVQEAASFGLPIIVSNGGSLPEVVNEGEYGVVYQAGDRAALREQLELVYRDVGRRVALSARAAELYRRSITWDETGRLIEAYLDRMEETPTFRVGG